MCDLGVYTTSFKGVVIERLMLVILFTFSYITAIRSMSINLKDNGDHLNMKSKVGFPYCVYLEQSKELDCTCQNINDNTSSGFANPDEAIALTDLLSGVASFKSLNTVRSQYTTKLKRLEENGVRNFSHDNLQKVEKIKIHSCKNLHLSLDFRPLPLPLYRLLIEDVEHVKINGFVIRQNETLDIWFRRINGTLTISGEMVCPDCHLHERKTNQDMINNHHSIGQQIVSKSIVQIPNELKPKVKLRIIEVGNITFNNFVSGMGYPSNTRIQMRNAESVIIMDSYFNELPSNGLEIFNVNNVTIFHSEFYNGSSDSIVVNGGVKNVHVKDCLMDKHWIMPLDRNSTDIYFRCTTSPTTFLVETGSNYMKDDPECVSTLSKWIGSRPAGVESTGAVVLAVVSALLLLIAIGFLFVLHRTGRLDRYI